MKISRINIGTMRIVLTFFCLFVANSANAELMTVLLDGAKERIHLDLEKGEMYIGNDCSPLLYFEKKSQRKSKSDTVSEFQVIQSKTRSASKTAIAPRIPNRIVISGNQVEIISLNSRGKSHAKGHALIGQAAKRMSSRKCG